MEPITRAFAPDLVIVAAGFDAAKVGAQEAEAWWWRVFGCKGCRRLLHGRAAGKRAHREAEMLPPSLRVSPPYVLLPSPVRAAPSPSPFSPTPVSTPLGGCNNSPLP